MKILATTDLFEINDIGGAIRYYFDLTDSLARRGNEVDSLLPCARDGEPLRKQYPRVRFHLYDAPTKGGLRELATAFRSRGEIRRLLKNNHHDILQLSQPKTAMGPMLLGSGPDVPVAYLFHSPWATEFSEKVEGGRGAGWWSRQIIEEKYLRRCSVILAQSEFMKRRFHEVHPGIRVPVHVVYGGVDIDRFCPPADRAAARAEAKFPSDRFVLFTARRFTLRTGLDLLVKAVAKLVPRYPELLLVMAGGGEQKAEIETLARELGLEKHVRFEGFIEESKLHVHYQAADLFVLPTRALEGFGLVSVEALACGTPVLGTPMGATVEILDPLEPALLMRDASVEAIVEGIAYWLEHRDALPELGRRGRDYVLAKYTWDRIAEETENLYKRCLR